MCKLTALQKHSCIQPTNSCVCAAWSRHHRQVASDKDSLQCPIKPRQQPAFAV